MKEKSTFTIRRMTQQDEAFLWEALYQAIHVPEGQEPLPRSILQEPKLAHYASQWGLLPGDIGFLAETTTGEAVGAAWLRLFPADDPGYGFVDAQTPELSVSLLPGYRGLGLGTRMLEALLEAAAQQFAAVSLSVSQDNAARGLYQRLGFIVVQEDASALTMLKKL